MKRAIADGRLERRAVIVGGGEPAAELIRSLEGTKRYHDAVSSMTAPTTAHQPLLLAIQNLALCGTRGIWPHGAGRLLIVSLPLSAEKRVLQLLRRLWVLPVDIRLSAHTNKLRFRPALYSYEGSVPFLDVFDKPIADWDSISSGYSTSSSRFWR
ncbi:MAG: hypothetical protein R3D29_07845 [Nitratireductor sp.]